jgi:hypothetical protein
MNKYGFHNFKIKELEYCDNCEEREKYYIHYYDTYKHGYNATLGGDGLCSINDDLIIKLYQNHNVKEIYEITGHSINAIREILINNGVKIKSVKIAAQEASGVSVRCVSIDDRTFQKRFQSMGDAARWVQKQGYTKSKIFNNVRKRISDIVNRVDGHNSAYGFYWYPIKKRNKRVI